MLLEVPTRNAWITNIDGMRYLPIAASTQDCEHESQYRDKYKVNQHRMDKSEKLCIQVIPKFRITPVLEEGVKLRPVGYLGMLFVLLFTLGRMVF